MKENSFFASFSIQIRVIKALIRREFIALYGRQGLGFLMMFAEPLVIMTAIMVIVSFRKLSSANNFPVYPFVLTGWGVMWLCRYPIIRMVGVLAANSSFLYHSKISVFDIIIARATLAIFSALVSFSVLFIAYIILFGAVFNDPLKVILSLFFVIWYVAVACVLTVTVGVYFGGIREKFTPIFAALHIFLTGPFFMVDWLPSGYRHLVLILPMVNVTEMMRDGFYGNIVDCYYDVWYIIVFNLVFTFFALKLLRRTVLTRDFNFT